jgi:non-specific protein-tyrosine kinase
MAAARHSLDVTVKTAEQAEDAAGTALLGAVPFDPSSARSEVISASTPDSHHAEAYRQVQTSMQFMDADRATKVVVVTSCVPEEGKSTTACNLAISLSEAGKRVLLIDGDLRRPRAARYLGLPSGAGLTSVLVGQAELDDVVQSWNNNTFDVLASGPVAPNPSKLVGSQHMRQLLDRLRERYDMVLIDAPPVLPVADAVMLASAADGAVLVVRHGKTRRDQLVKAAATLRRAEVDVLGAVLNFAPRRGPDSYYYGYASTAEHAAQSRMALRLNSVRRKIAVRL